MREGREASEYGKGKREIKSESEGCDRWSKGINDHVIMFLCYIACALTVPSPIQPNHTHSFCASFLLQLSPSLTQINDHSIILICIWMTKL